MADTLHPPDVDVDGHDEGSDEPQNENPSAASTVRRAVSPCLYHALAYFSISSVWLAG